MVYLYGADVTHLPDPKECPEIMKNLPEERKNKILKNAKQKKRQESLGAGLLLEYVLKLHRLEETKISYGENGKPYMDGVYFNLSHSHGKVICAVGKKEVGCDIEKIKRDENTLLRIADRFFCANEQFHLNKFQGSKKEDEFYRLWTMKESYMKWTGEGMQLSLNQFEIVMGEKILIKRDGEIAPCHFREYEIPDYKVSVCAGEAEFADYADVTMNLI